jgi:hypothetical protein
MPEHSIALPFVFIRNLGTFCGEKYGHFRPVFPNLWSTDTLRMVIYWLRPPQPSFYLTGASSSLSLTQFLMLRTDNCFNHKMTHLEYFLYSSVNWWVGIPTAWMLRVHFPPVQGFSLLHSVGPNLGPTQSLIQFVPRALFSEIMRKGREADHSPPSSK